MDDNNLTDKQKFFCQEYLIDLNATQAAIRAGYSEKTAKEQGYRLFTNVHIKNRIDELKAERAKRIQMDSDDLLVFLKNWLYSDITEIITLKPSELERLPKEVRMLIIGAKYTKRTLAGGEIFEEVIEYKFSNKERAADMIAKHIDFYEKNNKSAANNINFVVPTGNADTGNDKML